MFSHYSIPSLLNNGDDRRQVEMMTRMEQLKMLNKPFVKIFGTTLHTDKEPRCKTEDAHFRVFRLTRDVKRVLTARSAANWTGGAFWAFYDREAREAAGVASPTWEATMAHQENDYCDSQFRAVRKFSRLVSTKGRAF